MKKTRAVPRVVVTDKLRSYRAAHREVIPSSTGSRSTSTTGRRTATSPPGSVNVP